MNWMTSAKTRIYKTKKQKDHQKRVAAKNKLVRSSEEMFAENATKKMKIERPLQLIDNFYDGNLFSFQILSLSFLLFPAKALRNLTSEKDLKKHRSTEVHVNPFEDFICSVRHPCLLMLNFLNMFLRTSLLKWRLQAIESKA